MLVANAIIACGFCWTDLGVADPSACLAAEQRWLEQGIPRVGVWESDRECVVLGVSGRVDRDVQAGSSVPVLRRHSGGGAVLLGPGCLNYCIVAPFDRFPELRDVRMGWSWMLARMREALDVEGLRWEAPSDLALGGRKVSGNAQRRARHAVLHHGTLLYAFAAGRVERILRAPTREPAYRAGRSHTDFLGNLPLTAEQIRRRLREFSREDSSDLAG